MGSELFTKTEVDCSTAKYHVHEVSVKHRREIFAQTEKTDPSEKVLTQSMLILYGCVEFEGKDFDAIDELPSSHFDAIAAKVAEVSGMAAVSEDEEGEEKKPEES